MCTPVLIEYCFTCTDCFDLDHLLCSFNNSRCTTLYMDILENISLNLSQALCLPKIVFYCLSQVFHCIKTWIMYNLPILCYN